MANPARAAAIIDRIRRDIDSGFGIVPVLGSGISAQSGIPAGIDYQAYLFHCVSELFEKAAVGPDSHGQLWDPSRLRWPPYTSAPTYENLAEKMVTWTKQRSSELEGKKIDDPTMRAVWQSLGSVADWRAMLNLLSRTHVINGRIQIAEPDPRIIDSFFTNLTEGKRPNTAHMLLAHLADVLRLRVILTTNFDTLLEEAFRQLEMPVATFDVHYDAGFPDARFARAQRSIVKINGGRYGLRADFTLDRLPDAADFENFTSYLVPLGTIARSDDGSGPHAPVRQRNLLVMGVSGQERRTIALICQAMLNLEHLNTYWVCHQQREVEGVRTAFAEVLQALRAGKKQTEDALARLTVAATPDVGLFLLHLYQRIFLCLPPSGVPFKAAWPLPPPPYELARADSDKRYARSEAQAVLRGGVDRIREAIADLGKQKVGTQKVPANRWKRVLWVTGRSGVPSVAAQAFLEADDSRHRIWIDIEEGWQAVDLAAAVLEALRLHIGIAEPLLVGLTAWMLGNPAEVKKIFKSQFARLKRYSRRHFLIFINGRDRPGRHCEDVRAMDVPTVLSWLAAEPTVTVVYLGWETPAWKSAVADRCAKSLVLKPLLGWPPENVTATKVIQALRKLPNEKEQRRFARFLAVLSLFRRPCYLSMMNAWPLVALFPEQGDPTFLDKDQRRFEFVAGKAWPLKESYLDMLRRQGAIRDDDGQAVFMHRNVREELRKCLRESKLLHDSLWEIKAHQGIADWYLKLYRASGDVTAAIESLYHRLECIRVARQHGEEYLWESAATEARVTLRLARPALSPPVLQSYLAQRRLAELCRTLDDLAVVIASANLKRTLNEAREQLAQLQAQWEGAGKPQTPERSGDSNALLRVDSLDDVRRLIYEREYASAEKRLKEHFAVIGFAPVDSLVEDSQRGIVRYDGCRDAARQWAGSLRADQSTIAKAVRILRRYNGLCLLRAQLYERLGKEPLRRNVLVRAEAMYVCATELMRNIDDIRFLQTENAYLRANQGLALSWMNRCREAHRRYNEAYGYLNQMLTPPMSLRFATIDARRTETFLACLRHLGRRSVLQPGETRKSVRFQERGYLHDAIGAVERASYKSVDLPFPRWHSYLAELTMDVCCEIARQGPEAEELYARARDRSGYGEWFYDCFEAGFHAVGQDQVRLRRFIELATDFGNATGGPGSSQLGSIYVGKDCRRRIDAVREACLVRLGQLAPPADPEVRAYVVASERRPPASTLTLPPLLPGRPPRTLQPSP